MASKLASLTKRLGDAVDRFGGSSDEPDATRRKEILHLAREIEAEVEDPREKVDAYVQAMMEMASLRLLMDWNVFAHIPAGSAGVSYSDLAAKVDAEERLVRRLVRMLVAAGVLAEVDHDRISHTKFSQTCAQRESDALWFKVCYDNRNFVSMHWPAFFSKYGRKEPVNTTHDNPTSFAHGKEDQSIWEILQGQMLEDFNTCMRIRASARTRVGIFPFSWIAQNRDLVGREAALVVDVGGGHGHILQKMREECPEIPAQRMVLQDRPSVIEEVEQLDPPELRGTTKMVHDFFAEQPVKGALVYFFGKVMHDWSDHNCCKILGRIRDVMESESRILLDEFIMPESPTARTAMTDLAMMNIGARERTEQDWHALIQMAGLKVVKVWKTATGGEDGVIECKRAA